MSCYHCEEEPEEPLKASYFTPSAFPAQEVHSTLRIPKKRLPHLLLPCSALPPEGWANDRSCWLWFPVEITPRSQSEVAGGRERSASLLSTPPPSGWPFWLVFLTTPVCLLGHSLAAPSGLSQEEKQRSYGATQASQQALHSPSGVALLPLSTQRHLAGNLRILNTLKVACLF